MSMSMPDGLAARYLSHTFIETGIWGGGGIRVALSAGYARVWSCDAARDKYDSAVMLFRGISQVELRFGDSPGCLRELGPGGPSRTYWLDAHTLTTCPLVAELDVVLGWARGGDVVLIDDVDCLADHWGLRLEDVVARFGGWGVEVIDSKLRPAAVLVCRGPGRGSDVAADVLRGSPA